MSEIDNLIKKKKEIEKQIKIKRIEERENKKNNSKSKTNAHIRVSKEFNYDLEDIIKKRMEIGRDKVEISKPSITNLIRNHKYWGKIKNDCINFKFKQ